MGIGLTINSMANLEAKSALNLGTAQATSMGLGEESAGGLGISNLMNQEDEGQGMMKTLLNSGDKNRLKGAGLKKDLMTIGQAAITGTSSSTGLDPLLGDGFILSLKI